MTTQNYCIIENGVVTNVVVWDGDITGWQPAQGVTVLPQTGQEGVGWTYDGTNFIAPPEPEPSPVAPGQPASLGTQDL